MEFLSAYGLFLLKTLTLVVAVLLAVAGIAALTRKAKPKLEIVSLNKQYEEIKRMSHDIKQKKPEKKEKKQR